MSGPEETIDAAFAGRLGDFSLDARFSVPARGIAALVGPSGCGKTTILRCAAGLTRLQGSFRIGGETWQDDETGLFRKPHRRPVGYVFQEASLFSHLRVRDNLLYGARRAGPAEIDSALSFDAVVGLLGIAPLLDRAPDALSGGERQRVAIGRALLSRPRLLLMDEPLSALDRDSREDILPYLETLHDELMIPVLYVSHDMSEVDRLADSLVLMERGRVLASGPLSELEADPDLPLIRSGGAAVTLEGIVESVDETYRLTEIAIPGGRVVVPGLQGGPGAGRRLRIRASDVSFASSRPEGITILNCLPVRILGTYPRDIDESQVTVVAALGEDGAGARLIGRITKRSQEALSLHSGATVFALIKAVSLASSRPGKR